MVVQNVQRIVPLFVQLCQLNQKSDGRTLSEDFNGEVEIVLWLFSSFTPPEGVFHEVHCSSCRLWEA